MSNKLLLFTVLTIFVCTLRASAQQKKVAKKGNSSKAKTLLHRPDFQSLSEGRFALQVHSVAIEIDANARERETSLTLGGKELLSSAEVNAINYGSTFWTSPQSQWGWPPPASRLRHECN